MNVAEIWLWHVNTWRVAGRLQSHTLTVTQLEFSHDNRFLLSVSRDRHFSVFYLDKTGSCYSLFLCCSPYEQYLHIHTMHLYFKDRYTTKVVVVVVVVVVVIHPNQPQLYFLIYTCADPCGCVDGGVGLFKPNLSLV